MLLVWGELQKEREQKEMTGSTGKPHGNFFVFLLLIHFCFVQQAKFGRKR